MKKNIGISLTHLTACLLCFIILALKNAFTFVNITETMKHFCDGFSITGLLFLSLAILIWISNKGTFSMLSYGFKKIFSNPKTDYYTYKKNRLEHPTPCRLFFMVGSSYFLIGIIFLLLFYWL